MAVLKANRSRAGKKAFRRVVKFHQAKGKIITQVELSVSSDYYIIDISFSDKTALSFEIEPCVSFSPVFSNWKTGNYKPLKRWRTVHS